MPLLLACKTAAAGIASHTRNPSTAAGNWWNNSICHTPLLQAHMLQHGFLKCLPAALWMPAADSDDYSTAVAAVLLVAGATLYNTARSCSSAAVLQTCPKTAITKADVAPKTTIVTFVNIATRSPCPWLPNYLQNQQSNLMELHMQHIPAVLGPICVATLQTAVAQGLNNGNCKLQWFNTCMS
jgi:hypothetical protein